MRIGIDCGVGGAIALIHSRGIVNIWDMPIYIETTKAGVNRNFICSKGLDVILTEVSYAAPPATKVYVEKQGANKGPRSVDSPVVAYSIGYNYSTVREALRRSGANYSEVEARSWKKRAGLVKAKGEKTPEFKKRSLHLARELFDANDFFTRFKDIDRAEAALIAYFGE